MGQQVFVCLLAVLAAQACFAQGDEWRRAMTEAVAAENVGDYSKAAAAYREATAVAEALDRDNPRRAICWNGLATAYSWLGKFVDAESAYRRALVEAERSAGKGSQNYAFVLANLGSLFVETARFTAGEKLLRQSLAMQMSAPQPDEVHIALAQNALAEILSNTGKYREAERWLLPALAVLEKNKNETTELALAHNNLGVVRFFQKRYAEAEPLVLQALAALEQRVGPEHPLLAEILNNLASIAARTGRPEEAQQRLSRALDIAEHRLGADHPLYGALLENYAKSLRQTGDKAKAKTLLARSRQILSDSRRRNGFGSVVDVSALRQGVR